jgi:hypothetical protein
MIPALLLALATSPARAEAPAKNTLYQSLRTTGLAIAGLPPFQVPAPSMTSGLSEKEQQAVLEKVAGTIPLEFFLRKTTDAPFVIKISSLEDGSGTRQGQRIDVWFVAKGKLEAVARGDVLGQLLGTEAKTAGSGVEKAEALTAEDLRERGIKPQMGPGLEEKFGSLNATFLDSAMVTGVTRTMKTTTSSSILMAMELDPRFAKDAKFPNRWRSIDRRPDAAVPLGPPQPYSGFGGYAKVTDLGGGMVFVEMHTAFSEPPAWFGGRNLLRSKFPVVIQENVRKFRRRLAAESEK